ncbi:MAG: tolR: protein TolR [Firmicutes bacterium]|nr:tolR: protein TolR [Bacillota bacterium]
MKLLRRPAKKARIEIIPMIDTMFFLLVFFMVATLAMTTATSLPVNLPQASGVRDKNQQPVTLTLTKDGALFYNKESISTPAEAVVRLMRQNQGEGPVIINADRGVEYGRVVELMDAVRQGGVTRLAMAVESNRSGVSK